MTLEEVARFWPALQSLGVGGILAAIVLVLYKGWVVTAAECDRRVAAVEAQLVLLRERTALLTAEMEKREAIYRANLKEATEGREKVQASLDRNIEQLYRFSDVLGDLRDAIRTTPPRGGP